LRCEYSNEPGVQGICPDGWHIPTDEEWKQLEGEVDSQYGFPDTEWDSTGFRGFDVGLRLKSKSGWNSNGNGVNLFGFTVLPGGERHYIGSFYDLGILGKFCSSTEYNSDGIWFRSFRSAHNEVFRNDYWYNTKKYGYSVRCLK